MGYQTAVVFPMTLLLMGCVWFCLSSLGDNYLGDVKRWLEMHEDLVERINAQFEYPILHRAFRSNSVEYERAKRLISGTRAWEGNFLMSKKAIFARADWVIGIVYAVLPSAL